jgi:hypothetical protein
MWVMSLYGHSRAALYVRQDFDPLMPETCDWRQFSVNDVPGGIHSSYVLCTPAREIPDFSHSRDIRVDKASKISLHFLSPCFMQADVENSSLFEIAGDPFAFNKVFHLFDLPSLERRYMFCNSRPVGFKTVSCS